MGVSFMIMPGAKEFILERGGRVFVSLKPSLSSIGCNSPQITTVAKIGLGNPPGEESGNYTVSEINEVKICVHDSLFNYSGEATLTIDMETTLFDRRLTIGGFPGNTCNSCNDCTSCTSFGDSCKAEKL